LFKQLKRDLGTPIYRWRLESGRIHDA